jgi:hypothetical protein
MLRSEQLQREAHRANKEIDKQERAIKRAKRAARKDATTPSQPAEPAQAADAPQGPSLLPQKQELPQKAHAATSTTYAMAPTSTSSVLHIVRTMESQGAPRPADEDDHNDDDVSPTLPPAESELHLPLNWT